ncbi:MAG: hypothetical protein NTW87_31825 [Planctomycetota bacterium]|nr:hypothetical protein [Planctomycetota bacterium]
MRSACSLIGTLHLLGAASALLLAAARAEDAVLPELDIVATSKLSNAPKEHNEACATALRNCAAGCFQGVLIDAPPEPGTAAKDGAAKHRLLIEQTGSVTLGGITGTQTKFDGGSSGQLVSRIWLMDVQGQSTLQFRLLKWDGGKYTEMEKWTAPTPRSERAGAGGPVEVSRLSGRGADVASGKMPISLDDARRNALMSLLPGSIKDLILTRLLAVTVASTKADEKGTPKKAEPKKADEKAEPKQADEKAEPKKADEKAVPKKADEKAVPKKTPAKTPPKKVEEIVEPKKTEVTVAPLGAVDRSLEITIENKTPWPLKSLEAVVSVQGKPYAVGETLQGGRYVVLELANPIAGGQKETITTPARPQPNRPKAGVYDAIFVVEQR